MVEYLGILHNMEDVDFHIDTLQALLPKEAALDMPTCNMPEPIKETRLDPVDGMV